MSTCATCKFAGTTHPKLWDNDKQEAVELPQVPCHRILHQYDGRGNGGNGGSEGVAESTTVAFLSDGSGYAARLWVLPTFGCNLYEKKD